MKIASLIFENLMQDSFFGDTNSVPFLWQVIYHEATRSNHLVFDREDIEKFDKDSSRFPSAEQQGQDRVSEVMMDLLSCNELDKIQNTIRALTYTERKQVFSIYMSFIDRWRYQIKQSLN